MEISKDQIKEEESKALQILVNADYTKITSKPKLDQAKVFLTGIKDYKKSLKVRKERITKPMTDALKNIRDLFRPVEDKISNAEIVVKGKISEYLNVLEAEAEKKKEEVEKKINEGDINLDQATKTLEKVESKTDNIKKRVIKEVEITDINKIPRKYLVPDMVFIRKDALDGKDIEGIKVIEKTIIVS